MELHFSPVLYLKVSSLDLLMCSRLHQYLSPPPPLPLSSFAPSSQVDSTSPQTMAVLPSIKKAAQKVSICLYQCDALHVSPNVIIIGGGLTGVVGCRGRPVWSVDLL